LMLRWSSVCATLLLGLPGTTSLHVGHGSLHLRHGVANRRCTACKLLSDDELSFSALLAEAQKRETFGLDLGRSHALASRGPHHTTTPKEVVEHVLTMLRTGNVGQAFNFTCIPVTKRGTHKSSTDWTHRMAWEKCQVINDQPSGGYLNERDFRQMVQTRYPSLLETDAFRFVGDDSAWQQKKGKEKMTAVKEFIVEVKTLKEEHLLFKFKLVYDWLVQCHLVASVSALSASTSKHFPGSDDIALDI